jgi:hypothetical protein
MTATEYSSRMQNKYDWGIGQIWARAEMVTMIMMYVGVGWRWRWMMY